ncbi:conserved hypothetical protein [Ricinus communis]|uniref:Nitrate regulatory gene2 protein-like n=1 Tax=Ricinus communis TaxID=3988 RepID=B9SXB0_RICCO|nr:conserved hypothetical protein [Ricinus communis]
MGCGLSKQNEEDDVVALCGERKRLLKLAVEKRYAFADAQFKYNQSLYAVAMALRLFVARHSSPSSPFLLTFPSCSDTNGDTNETIPNDPMFLQQSPTQPTLETTACQPLETKAQETQEDNDDSEEESAEESESEELCEHFYGENDPPEVPSPNGQFGWDFFYSYDEMRSEMLNGFTQIHDDDLRAVREKEGIPELEDDGEKVMNEDKNRVVEFANARGEDNNNNVGQEETKGLGVIDTPANGRELLEALKDIEDHFLRSYDSGLDISRMLEANRVPLQSGLEEIKESSNKLIRSITWNRSTSSRSSSSKSLLTSTSTNSSVWTDFKADLFDDFGMEAGSHSLTLGRLYAWEKKLYQEVKAGDKTRKIYERKCSYLRRMDATGDGFYTIDKSTDEVKELHSRISVAIRSVESISERIEKLRDTELQPQLLELLHGLMRNWKMMLESHETQKQVMLEVKFFNCPAYEKFSNDCHRLATLQLEAELDNWCACFSAYVTTQKAYIEALSGWLSKFIAPEFEFYSSRKYISPPCRINGPPLLVICHEWLAWLDKLPDNAVTYAMKSFGKDIHALWSQQGKEQQQKRKVDDLAKELDRRTLAFQRAERRILTSKISEQETEASVRHNIEYLVEGKRLLNLFRNTLDEEKEKHLNSMQGTQQITVSGFQTGFSSVFESLAEFSKASVKMYVDLVTYSANAKTAEKNNGDVSYIDGIFS